MDYVDNYCERLAPGLWGEPANAATNGAFLIASGLLFWLLARHPRRAPVGVWLLPVTTAVVGLCSLSFHLFATRLTGLLDTLSIVAFILIAMVVAVHYAWAVAWTRAWLVAPGFVAFAVGVNAALAVIGGERLLLGGYLPALVALAGFGLAIRLTGAAEIRRIGVLLGWAAAIFAGSLAVRTLDGPLCPMLPMGVHFLWHCLNATVLFLVSYSAMRCWLATSDDAHGSIGSPGTGPI